MRLDRIVRRSSLKKRLEKFRVLQRREDKIEETITEAVKHGARAARERILNSTQHLSYDA